MTAVLQSELTLLQGVRLEGMAMTPEQDKEFEAWFRNSYVWQNSKEFARSAWAHQQTKIDEMMPKGCNAERLKIAREIIAFLNAKTGRNYRAVHANLNPICARLKEGATEVELRQVVAKKAREWGNDEVMEKYLRPKTLFNATNFAQYQGELV